MATADNLRKIALSLDGTTEKPHFDRAGFKVARIYAVIAVDGKSAHLLLTSDEQEFKCLLAPDAFSPIPNAWGRKGWTTVVLAQVSVDELSNALKMAYAHALPKAKRRVQ